MIVAGRHIRSRNVLVVLSLPLIRQSDVIPYLDEFGQGAHRSSSLRDYFSKRYKSIELQKCAFSQLHHVFHDNF